MSMEQQMKQAQEDHDLLVRIDEKLKSVTESLNMMSKNNGEKLAVMESNKVDKNDMQKWISELKTDIDKSFKNFMDEIAALNKIKDDHERRLRKLEKLGYLAIGGLGLLEIILKSTGH